MADFNLNYYSAKKVHMIDVEKRNYPLVSKLVKDLDYGRWHVKHENEIELFFL